MIGFFDGIVVILYFLFYKKRRGALTSPLWFLTFLFFWSSDFRGYGCYRADVLEGRVRTRHQAGRVCEDWRALTLPSRDGHP